MEQTFITISHLDDFMSEEFMEPGAAFSLVKEPNCYDEESISVYSGRGVKCGYVANSWNRVARGTHSAGYISRDFKKKASCIVRFRTENIAIAELVLIDETQPESEKSDL